MRRLAPELDPLRLGTGWTFEELSRPQIIVESSFGDSHPGSGHLDKLVEAVCRGVADAGGRGARYFCTDICDGESQGTDGINFSLASREMIAGMIEIHANATPFDGGVYIASCDKGLPGNLMGMVRVNIPSVVVPGGTMSAGPELLTLEQLGMYSAQFERGEISEERLSWAKRNACPSCGACSFIGTASTMQIMAEAMGLALPGSALLPATSPDLLDCAYRAGRLSVELARKGIKPSDIVTPESLENAILVHAAISGSTNALLHLPAIAHEYGIKIDGDSFDRLHRGAHYLVNLRPAGRWPAEFLYYAGGVPAVMEELRSVLQLDAMSVTGKTIGENLDELKASGFYPHCRSLLDAANAKYGISVTREDIIRPYDKAISSDPELGRSIALITDGRFSGASTGPVIGHCSPEAQSGGPIALVEEGDLIEIDIPDRRLNIVGVKGERKSPEEMEIILSERRKSWTPKPRKYKNGVLRIFSEHASSPMDGAWLSFED